MANTSTKTFTANGSWTAPAGVFSVDVLATKNTQTNVNGQPFNNGASNFVLDTYGNLYAWGGQPNANSQGQLGLGDNNPRSSPVLVLGGLTFTRYFVDTFNNLSTFGLTNLGKLYSWGFNRSGNLGLGDVVSRSSPVAVLGNAVYTKVISADEYAAALTPGGQIYSWGKNLQGQLGLGDVTPRSSPVLVLGGLTFADMDMSLGSSSGGTSSMMFGIQASGAVYAWGVNDQGQLGVGDQASRSSPVLVLGGQVFGSLSVNWKSTVALNSAGAAYAWGANTAGCLGVGDVTSRSSPVAVLGGLTFTRIFALGGTAPSFFGLTASGALYAWGSNANGQLGVGNVAPRSSPVLVLGGLTFVDVFATRCSGVTSIFGLTAAGQLYAWGINTNGQLGVGDVASRSSPVLVLGGLTFASGVMNLDAFIAETTTGQVYAWGNNINGQLGVGDVTPRSSPVLVLGAIGPNLLPTRIITQVAVVPGTTYTVVLKQSPSTFGATVVGNNSDSITLTYQQ